MSRSSRPGKVLDALFVSWRRRRRSVADSNFIGFDKYRKHGAYHWGELDRSPEYREKVTLLTSMIGPTTEAIDLGCGDGAMMFGLSGHCASITGVDADFDAVRLARRELRRANVDNAQCHQLALGDVSLQSLGRTRGFDLVYSMDVIEHLPDPAQLVHLARELLAPGGVAVIGTPLHITDELVSPYHVREFSIAEVRDVLAKGLHVESEVLLSSQRADGVLHPETFYVGVARGTSDVGAIGG